MLITAERTVEIEGRRGQKTRRKKSERHDKTESGIAASVTQKTEGQREYETETPVAAICSQLQALQRVRVSFLKSRIMLNNRLVSSVAVALGYRSGLEENERKAAFDAARKAIKRITSGEHGDETEKSIAPLVTEAMRSIDGFDRYVKLTERKMVKLAAKLPVAAWVEQPEQRGFGLQSLAILIGECGDLAGYANPGKLWRRMGCAPFESDGVMRMGATWKSKGGLSAAEWEAFGYSPRRRSVSFVFGENLVKLNFVCGGTLDETGIGYAAGDLNNGKAWDGTENPFAVAASCETANDSAGAGCHATEILIAGPYRSRYDTTKAAKLALADKDWPKLRCHRHGMLLAVKLLMRELWKAWNPGMVAEQSW